MLQQQLSTRLPRSGSSLGHCFHAGSGPCRRSVLRHAGGASRAIVQASKTQQSQQQAPISERGADKFDAQELLEELKDQSDLGKRGEAWTVAQLVAIPLILFPPVHFTELTTVLGVVLGVAGLSAMVLGQQSLGKSLSPLPVPRKNSEFVTSGIYEYMRHPMYGGVLMGSLGLAAATHDETRLLLALGLWFVLEQKVALEEGFLVERYGAAYEGYKLRVKKFIPYIY